MAQKHISKGKYGLRILTPVTECRRLLQKPTPGLENSPAHQGPHPNPYVNVYTKLGRWHSTTLRSEITGQLGVCEHVYVWHVCIDMCVCACTCEHAQEHIDADGLCWIYFSITLHLNFGMGVA